MANQRKRKPYSNYPVAHRQAARLYQERAKEEGLCVVSRQHGPALPGRRFCADCWKKQQERNQQRRPPNTRAYVCSICGENGHRATRHQQPAAPPALPPLFSVLVPMIKKRAQNQKGQLMTLERGAVKLAFYDYKEKIPPLPITVTLTLYSVKLLDDESLAGALKVVKEQVAEALGLSDDADPRLTWICSQETTQDRQQWGMKIALARTSASIKRPESGT